MLTPKDAGFFQPAEWSPHEGTFIAWPSAAHLWLENLEPAQREVAALIEEIAAAEPVHVLAPEDSNARQILAHLPIRWHAIPYGDIWLRDIAPIWVTSPRGDRASVIFPFNGWGGKYKLPHDDEVAGRIAATLPFNVFRAPFILEGGSVDTDGDGTILTTAQCLLNPNRNPGLEKATFDRLLATYLGAEKVLWLDEGLLNDHTDGHVDTLARFIRPGVVVAMEPSGSDDPNAEVLRAIVRDLSKMRDAQGRLLEVFAIPSPGRVETAEGEVMPASYVNFYITNKSVVVPQYGTPYDQAALSALAPLFPGRKVVGSPALAILAGGGAFHCITQQLPAEVEK